MGNSSKKSNPSYKTRIVKSKYFGFSDFSLVNFTSNLSSLSFTSSTTQKSAYSATRPWSRVSRNKLRQSTLSNTLEACKTAWPVPHIESAFLPEFKIKKKNEINFEMSNYQDCLHPHKAFKEDLILY
ncbi:uncharacterized protein LOC142323729 isoform X1 [Lycorma delicatula]|uniref:uncharacterized protein LOC142323729 isoform X1 n=1 Tax=Lycorma delicatula TaxID=130591 RepID=UPI003F510A59